MCVNMSEFPVTALRPLGNDYPRDVEVEQEGWQGAGQRKVDEGLDEQTLEEDPAEEERRGVRREGVERGEEDVRGEGGGG